MKENRILYISYDGMTDPLGESQVISYLSRLSEEGFNIDIVSFEKKEVFISKKKDIEAKIQGTSINWHPLLYTKKPPVLSTIKDIFSAWRLVKNLQKKNNFDIVHCRGYISAILGLRMKRIFKVKFIFDMRGWWPDEKLESGNWKGLIYRPIYRYFKKLENTFFEEADYVVSLTFAGKEEIIRGRNIDQSRVGVIPTCVDFEIFKEYDQEVRNKTRKALNIPADATVLTYTGSLGGNYSVDDVLKIYVAFKSVNSRALLLIVSKADPAGIFNVLHNYSLNAGEVRIVSSDFNKVYEYLHASDFGIIFYKMEFSVIGRSPTKLGEYWACGIPVISLKGIGDLDSIMNKYPLGGVLVSNFDAGIVTEAFKMPPFVAPDKKLLREYSMDYFDILKGVSFYKKAYEYLLKINSAVTNKI